MNVAWIKVSIFGMTYDRYLIFLWATAILFPAAVAAFRPKDFPFTRLQLLLFSIGFIACGFFGAHAMHVIINYPRTKFFFWKAMFGFKGFAYIGAPLFAFAFLWIVARLRRVRFWVLGDYIAPFLMLDRILGRTGCFLYGCCRGIDSTLPWACSFPGSSFRVHPTQLYELAFSFGILIAARYLYKRARAIPLLTFSFTIFWYSLFRIGDELLRVDGPFFFGRFKWAYPTYGLVCLIGAAGIVFAVRRERASGRGGALGAMMAGACARLILWTLVAAAIVLPMVIFVFKGKVIA